MDSIFFENRDYFVKRMQDLDSSSVSREEEFRHSKTVTESPDTAVCVRIRPLTEHEIKQGHVKGVLTDNLSVANIHEPRRKVRGKPDLDVLTLSQDKPQTLTKSLEFVFYLGSSVWFRQIF